MEIQLTLDAKNLARFRRLANVSRLMAAKSLTFTAEKAVPAWRAGHSVFHRRNTWIDKGVRMRAATPSNLQAQVGTIDKYMQRHVKGLGEAKTGSLFVPNQPIGDQPTHTKIRSMLRRADSTNRKTFRIGDLIVRRATKRRLPLIILGRVAKRIEIPERLDALGIVSGVVRTEFPRVYERLITKWAETGRT